MREKRELKESSFELVNLESNSVIITALNKDVNDLNTKIVEKINKPEKIYQSIDSVMDLDVSNQFPVEFLNTIHHQ